MATKKTRPNPSAYAAEFDELRALFSDSNPTPEDERKRGELIIALKEKGFGDRVICEKCEVDLYSTKRALFVAQASDNVFGLYRSGKIKHYFVAPLNQIERYGPEHLSGALKKLLDGEYSIMDLIDLASSLRSVHLVKQKIGFVDRSS